MNIELNTLALKMQPFDIKPAHLGVGIIQRESLCSSTKKTLSDFQSTNFDHR